MMIPALFQRQSNSLIVRPTGASASLAVQTPLARYGDRIRNQIERGLTLRLNHRTREGRMFCPRIVASMLLTDHQGAPALHAVVVDPETLFHYRMDTFTDPNFLRALALTVGRRVFVYQRIARLGDTMPSGIWFVTPLREASDKSACAVELPRVVNLDLGSVARNKLLVPVGVSAQGAVLKPLSGATGIGHALIPGVTGAGKSSWEHCALAALLTLNTPTALRIALIDPKRGILQPWAKAPHLLKDGYAYDLDDSENLLERLVKSMDERGDLRTAIGCQNIEGYNGRADQPLPYILLVIDEYRDLADRRSIVALIDKLARRGRSEGIIVWAATQSATAISGMPGALLANLATRITFRMDNAEVARRVQCSGAEGIPKSLPGRLFARIDTRPVMMQGFYMDDDELAAIADGLGGQAITGNGQSPALRLSDQERQVVTWAMGEGRGDERGYITLAVWQQFGTGYQEAKRRLADWRTRGWLVKDPNHRNSHRLAGELLSVWQSGAFGEFGSLAGATPTPPPSQTCKSAKHPARLLDVQDAAFMAEIQPRLDELTAGRLSAQQAYEQILEERRAIPCLEKEPVVS